MSSRAAAELGQIQCRDRFAGRLARMLPPRIDEDAVLSEAVVEVRPRRRAGRADAADQLPLVDMRAGA